MAKQSVLLLLIVSFFLQLSISCIALADEFPFAVGEKLIYELKWELVPAGEAFLEVFPNEVINGVEARHFQMRAKSNSFVDVFYKVRDVVDGYTDMTVSRSLFYKKKQNEGKTARDIVVTFDWQTNQASYSNCGQTKKPIVVSNGTFDPFSVIYFCRLFDFESDEDIVRPVTDGKKIVEGVALFKGRQTISVNGKAYDTFLIEPQIEHISGVFKKSKRAKIQIWLTADNRRIPVRIKSKVVVGSFIADLVEVGVTDR